MKKITYTIEPLAENALILTWESSIDADINRQVLACARTIERTPFFGFVECVPAFASLAVYFDFFKILKKNVYLNPKIAPAQVLGLVKNEIKIILQTVDYQHFEQDKMPIRVPVCYEAPYALDLDIMAESLGKTASEIVALHTTPIYRVFMVGFSVGFPYLGGLPPALFLPRLSTPRQSVAAGSVGIGGQQTGIYPSASPGGWRIIGRTPLSILDFSKPNFSLFKAGDAVEFYPISKSVFEAYECTNP